MSAPAVLRYGVEDRGVGVRAHRGNVPGWNSGPDILPTVLNHPP